MNQKNPKFIVGTFYTRDTPYEEVFRECFEKSIKKFPQIKYYAIAIDNKKDWQKNVAEKPRVIKDILNQMSLVDSQDILVFLDSDASIERYPELFDNIPSDYDIGYHSLDWRTWYNRPESTTKEILSGTMFFRNNPKVKKLLTEWYNSAIISNKWEQKVLEEILLKDKELGKLALPLDYCYINSLPNGSEPYVKLTEPVIVHHQSSRTLKRIINKQE